ncbi:gluconokinase [Kocuria palustris]|nr:gluconokinase [Kocuria palustris]MBN6758381.1 gluconokinase [Kocuria palustris]MBN6763469.1 gluconokinase [Kocuria palustris]MBN6782689.1 gluconokinase [Kocuria palustris]MBN6799119.1 gluconokinase [Kocuria palustris]
MPTSTAGISRCTQGSDPVDFAAGTAAEGRPAAPRPSSKDPHVAKSAPRPPKTDDEVDFAVPLKDAVDPLVLALDVGSTATRGSLHDATGTPVRGYRDKIPHHFTTAVDGTSTIDPDQVVEELCRLIDQIIGSRQELVGRVGGVAIDTFASSLVGTDSRRRATTTCYTYADSRSCGQLAALRQEVDEAEIQQLTGTRLHTSYLTPRFRWLRETEPEAFAATTRWMSLGEYFHLRLLGKARVGTSTAAWTGLLDRRTGDWSDRMLELAQVERESLSLIARPNQPIREVPPAVAERWPALRQAKWFAPVADGLSANVGSGGRDATTMVTSMATSGAMRVLLHEQPETIPSGLWCYRIDDTRCLLGGAINDASRAVTWAEETLRLPEDLSPEDVAQRPIDPTTPLVLPFLTGERSTGWVGDARAAVLGLSAATSPEDILRGVMEGVVAAYGRVAQQLTEASGEVERLVTAGGMTQSVPGLQQQLSDLLGRSAVQATFKRSTLRGTAVLASEVLSPDIEPVDPPYAHTFDPNPEAREHWDRVAERFQEAYEGLFA